MIFAMGRLAIESGQLSPTNMPFRFVTCFDAYGCAAHLHQVSQTYAGHPGGLVKKFGVGIFHVQVLQDRLAGR